MPVQGIMRLLQVHKYCVQDFLTHVHSLMKQLSLKGGGTFATNLPETMEDIVEGNGGGETAIKNHRHHLTHHLH